MTISEVHLVGLELDTDHTPETNGRMAVCRRCGVRTDSPSGERHLLSEEQLTRSQTWLRGQALRRRLANFQNDLS